MEIYSLYEVCRLTLSAFSMVFEWENPTVIFIGGFILGLLGMIAFFILQGVGLYTLAKHRNMQKRWLAFIPFANIYYMGKLAGSSTFFGHKMKNPGLYAMIAQAVGAVVSIIYIFAECYLYINHGNSLTMDGVTAPVWTGLTGFALTVSKIYEFIGDLYPIIGLVAEILMLLLVMGLYKKYIPKNYMFMSMLSLFVPVARFIIVFVIRDNKEVNYEAYIRARREEYIRQQQQRYGNYGNPYANPYGNPYNPYGNPYGQGGYAGQNNGQNTQPKDDEPFGEFASDSKKSEDGQGNSSDGFFD